MKRQAYQTNGLPSQAHGLNQQRLQARLIGDKPRHAVKSGAIALALLTAGVWVGGLDMTPAAVAMTASTQTAQLPVNARVIYVNPALGSDDSSSGTSDSNAYRTITYALEQADVGTVIQLAPGSYSRDTGEVFPLLVRPGVIVRGNEANKGQTVLIIGGGSYVSPTFASQNVTLRMETDSEVRGIAVTNPNTRGTAIWVESTAPTIRNSTFANSLRDGVFITGTGAPIIEGNVFSGNSGNGIAVARAAQGQIRGNVFQNTGFGIAVSDTAAPEISDNQIVQNTDGIVISNVARPVLRSNVVENNVRDGVVAISSAQPDLGTADSPGQNLLRNNGRYDLYNATASNTLVAVGNQIDPDRISGTVDFVAATVVPASRFPDVGGHWAQAYIEALAERDIIGGFPDGTYRPNDPVTRAQFAAIITKAFAPTAQRAGISFVDVSSTFWAYQAIQTAYTGGFLSGYPGGVFQPEQRIPRVQALVSLASGLDLSADDGAALQVYQDGAQIPDWAARSVAAATQRRIVVNYPVVNRLNPEQAASRADIAAFVYQALVSAGSAEEILSPYVVVSLPGIGQTVAQPAEANPSQLQPAAVPPANSATNAERVQDPTELVE